jgi:RNA polymerase sigma-B factor
MALSVPARTDHGRARRRSEAAKLARLRRTGDPALREAIIEDHLPLAWRVALRYAGGRESLDDLFQVACLGLVKAVDRYDPTRGSAFSSYAVPTMTGELRRHLRDHSWAVHVPRRLQELAIEVQRARRELRRALHREATVGELADALQVSQGAVLEALGAMSARETRSLDRPVDSQDDRAAARVVAIVGHEEAGYERAEQRIVMQDLQRRLSHSELEILALRLVADLPQREIARRVGVSQMTVSRALSGVRRLVTDACPAAGAV